MIKIKMFGTGGQGIVTAIKWLSYASCLYEDKYAKTLPSFGHERRGALVTGDIIIDDNQILLNTYIKDPDYIIIFDPAILSTDIEIFSGMKDDTKILINSSIEHSMNLNFPREKKVYFVDASSISKVIIGNYIPNSAMLGAIASLGIVKKESLAFALENYLNEDIFEKNKTAMEKAYHETKTF